MADELRAAVRGSGTTVVLDLEGAFTVSGAAVLERAHAAACQEAARNLVLNFRGVDYVNSAGIAVLIGSMGRVREAGQRLALVGLNPHYRKIFHVMGRAQFAPVFDSERDALEAMQTL